MLSERGPDSCDRDRDSCSWSDLGE